MHTVQIKGYLHKYIDTATDAQIRALYIILEEKIEALQDRITVAQYNEEIEISE